MKVVVIEDEPLAAEKLCEYIKAYDAEAKIIAHLASIKETAEWFRLNAAPELVFSDIELLDGNIFEFLENRDVHCPIIFTTAYDQFLMRAFERSGIAYLLKPFTYNQFVAAMRKFETLKNSFVAAQIGFWRDVQTALVQPQFKERFVVKVKGNIKLLETANIAFVQTQHEIPFAFDAAGSKYALNENLTTLERLLDPRLFFRLNRGEIVNLKFIDHLETASHDRLTVKIRGLNANLVCSIARTPALRKWLAGENELVAVPSSTAE